MEQHVATESATSVAHGGLRARSVPGPSLVVAGPSGHPTGGAQRGEDDHMTSPGQPGPSLSATADRLRDVLVAHRSIARDLVLDGMLVRIAAQVRRLVNADYAALGVVGPERTVEQFVEDADGRTAAPAALHVLLNVIDQPATITHAADLRPELRERVQAAAPSFLGVQFRIRGEVLGAFYVTAARADAFGAEDAELLETLAAMAGGTVVNARLYDDARRSRDWLTASGAVARALLAGDSADLLLDVVSTALRVARADYGGLILPSDDGRLRVAATAGTGAERFHGLLFDPQRSAMGQAIVAGRSLSITDMTRMASPEYENVYNFGPMMTAPLIDANGVRGAVLLMRTADRLPFTRRDLEQATAFATQVALALELNEARAHAEELRTLEVRHSIAQALHDNVMQRLFATGMGLQQLAESPLAPEVAARLRQAVVDLDETIDAIRTQVFGLRQADLEPPDATGSGAAPETGRPLQSYP